MEITMSNYNKKRKLQETLKIVKLKGEYGILNSNKLSEIASLFKTSNRRTLQFCLADCYAVQSLPKPPRFFNATKNTTTIFIPFSPLGLDSCNFALKSLKVSFTSLANKSIERIYEQMKAGRDFEADSIFYGTYIGNIYDQEIEM